MRVLNTGPVERERESLVRKFERDLQRFWRIPLGWREAELADTGEETCLAMLAELRAGGSLGPKAARAQLRSRPD